MTHSLPRSRSAFAFTLCELLITIGLLALLISILLPALNHARKKAAEISLAEAATETAAQRRAVLPGAAPDPATRAGPPPAMAHVFSFAADVGLTPRLSVGTAEPESIYEATFKAQVVASHPRAFEAGAAVEGAADDACELHLPLPPQVISLAGVSVSVDAKKGD